MRQGRARRPSAYGISVVHRAMVALRCSDCGSARQASIFPRRTRTEMKRTNATSPLPAFRARAGDSVGARVRVKPRCGVGPATRSGVDENRAPHVAVWHCLFLARAAAADRPGRSPIAVPISAAGHAVKRCRITMHACVRSLPVLCNNLAAVFRSSEWYTAELELASVAQDLGLAAASRLAEADSRRLFVESFPPAWIPASVDQKKAGSVFRLKPSRTREGSSQEKTAAGHSTRRARSAERQSDSRRQLARPGGFRDSEVSGSRDVLSPRRRAASLLRALDFQRPSRPDALKLVCL
ncbi:hypothetical protein PYCCODRAFT_1012603 [Trametes coccinea BRFM310]|uniref:Uncharacterized protein n=1 Tax=Trametes coccinea (strain BRFM310) TaxID=1353009 RepID=A0A1Y2IAV3_TRAC3|nr:hypothetical protein PYCCODRAFT_1012603 [Trametes coccinea BRFM310]